MNIKLIFIIYISFIIIFYLLCNIHVFKTTIFKCSKTYLTNVSQYIIENISNSILYSKSKKLYITIIYNNFYNLNKIINIDKEYYSLILMKNLFITNRVIIQNCKIILFKGQCNNKVWYKNYIKKAEIIPSVNYGFNIINWHGDGVFHGTVEGLTRIIPYINFLIKRPYIYIFIPYPRYIENTAENILVLLGFSKNRILYGNYFVKNLYIPTPFYCIETSTPLLMKFNNLLRNKMMKKNCLVSYLSYILIIQRSTNRIIENFEILKKELSKHFNYSIITYFDTNKNLDEIYCWFTYAKVIIAYHGSGLTNIYFSKENTVVIELSPLKPIYAFAKLGSQLGFNYYIYKLPYNKLYIKYVYVNISSFIHNMKINDII